MSAMDKAEDLPAEEQGSRNQLPSTGQVGKFAPNTRAAA
jgi:hypothetical protein